MIYSVFGRGMQTPLRRARWLEGTWKMRIEEK